MVTKTYALTNDLVDATFLFKTGKAKLKAHFQGGVPDPRSHRRATLITSDPVAQLIIENSPEFLGGTIVIQNVSDDGSGPTKTVEPVAKKTVKKKDEGPKSYPDATSLGQAVNVLTDLGAPADKLLSPADVLETASEMRVTFPNLKLK